MSLRRRMTILVLAVMMLTAGCSPKSEASLTLYSAGGLGDWYRTQFERFTKDTGIKVNVFEFGSGEVVSRVNSSGVWQGLDNGEGQPPADVIVTLPPFIQKAAKANLLQASGVDTSSIPAGDVGPGGVYVSIATTALCFIANPAADPPPGAWSDLLKPAFKGRLQYSTPGESGDGTAVLLLLQHLMGKQGALDYLAKLHANTVSPVSSTAALQNRVSSGELLVANGDVQMNLAAINDGAKFDIFFPAMPDNTRTTVVLPYVAGVTAASKRPDEAKRLMTFLLSEETQKSLYAGAFGIPVRQDTSLDSDHRTPNAILNGVKLWAPEWDTVLSEIEADLAAYQDAVR